MAEIPPYTIEVNPDSNRFNRYRWAILEGGKIRHNSKQNFATEREAYTDAKKLVEKLIITWQKQN
jgi:hypothetical protein